MAGGLFATVAAAQQTQYSHGEPSALEQQMLEMVNRARMNPTQEGIILDTVNTAYSADARARKPAFFTNLRAEFASYPAVAPLAFNPKLIQSARGHSQDMITRNFFSHVNPSGQSPTARAAAAGYDVSIGENLDGGGAASVDNIQESHFGLMVDYDNIDTVHPLGHRINVLSSGYTEIGVGVVGPRYGGKITQDFGGPARSFILGVAYSDTNNNGRYDAGEGLAGVTVKPGTGNWYAVTSGSGGYAIPIDTVQTISDTVNVPFPVQGNTWAQVQPYDAAYRAQQIAAAPNITVNLTWTGGGLSGPKTTSVTMKRPTLINYKLKGTDGWSFNMSMVTAQNAKADLTPNSDSILPPQPSAPLRDFNADGKGDLLFQNNAGQIAAWFMNGSGAIGSSAVIYGAGLGDWRVKAIADLNSDGIADIILQNNAGQVYVWYMTSAGTIASGAFVFSGGLGDWKVKGAADVNSDGKADLILQNNAGQIFAWYMNGQGAIASGAFIYSGGLADWKLAAAVDLNGDGNADLTFQNNAGQLFTWYMNGSGAIASSGYLYAGALGDWRLTAVADLNSDGNADLVFQSTAGQIFVWYMNGKASIGSSAYVFTGALGEWRLR
jgi:hypothetical protein